MIVISRTRPPMNIALNPCYQGLVSRKDGHLKPPFPGYVSIGLLKMTLSHTRLDTLLDMTAETKHWGLSNPRFAARSERMMNARRTNEQKSFPTQIHSASSPKKRSSHALTFRFAEDM
jgi:hypothetical protein